jgi:hypothetical protein
MDRMKMIVGELGYVLSLLIAVVILIPFALLIRGFIEIKLAINKINLGDKNV